MSAEGNHHGLIPAHLIVPYYRNGNPQPANRPIPTITAVDRHALVMRYNNPGGDLAAMSTPATEPVRTITAQGRPALLPGMTLDIDDVLFRMLTPPEISRTMAFADDYIVLGDSRQQVCQYGNAVTPPVAELIVSALVEAITGQDLERHVLAA